MLGGVMPSIEMDSGERKDVDEIIKFVRNFGIDKLSVNGRMVLAIELVRLFKPEIDELKRRKTDGPA